MERTVIITRHGNRADFVDPSWPSRAKLPHDPPLSEDGRIQAQELAARLEREGIAHIFSSPFIRAIETACIVAERLSLPVKVERGLSEWMNPRWFAAPPRLTPEAETEGRFPMIDRSYRSVMEPGFPETEEDVHARVARALRILLREWQGTLLLVGHGASMDAAAHALAGKELEVRSTLCSIVKIAGADGSWRVLLNGDTSHLSCPEGTPRRSAR